MPQSQENIDYQMPVGQEFFSVQNAQGCPRGMVREGIEQDVCGDDDDCDHDDDDDGDDSMPKKFQKYDGILVCSMLSTEISWFRAWLQSVFKPSMISSLVLKFLHEIENWNQQRNKQRSGMEFQLILVSWLNLRIKKSHAIWP